MSDFQTCSPMPRIHQARRAGRRKALVRATTARRSRGFSRGSFPASSPGRAVHSGPHHVRESLLERIEARGRFPEYDRRFCTSDLKRGPIQRELRRYLKGHPRFGGFVPNAMGMRASESPARSRLAPRWRKDRTRRAGREWFDWLPVHGQVMADMVRFIDEAGQSLQWADAADMSRVSCSFCILASRRSAPHSQAPPLSVPVVHRV